MRVVKEGEFGVAVMEKSRNISYSSQGWDIERQGWEWREGLYKNGGF
jgi:hypothetical protein